MTLESLGYHIRDLRGWSDEYLGSKKKRKFWKNGDVFLNIISTWPSDAPTSLTRLKNTFSRVLPTRPLWQRWSPHSTQISVQRVTFSSLETKRSHTGPNLEKMVDGVAVRSPNRPIWPGRERMCKPVRCHDGRALFSSVPCFLQFGGESAQ